MVIVYVLLALGWLTSMFVLWCIIRVGDTTNRPRPTLDPLTVYLMQREARRAVNPDWDQLAEEEAWRAR